MSVRSASNYFRLVLDFADSRLTIITLPVLMMFEPRFKTSCFTVVSFKKVTRKTFLCISDFIRFLNNQSLFSCFLKTKAVIFVLLSHVYFFYGWQPVQFLDPFRILSKIHKKRINPNLK